MSEMKFEDVKRLLTKLPGYIADPDEQMRLASYAMYEAIYWNVTGTLKAYGRGDDAVPIYIPTGKTIVETMHRFVATGMNVVPDPNYGTDQERLLAAQVWTDIQRREKFLSTFNSNKRFGLIRGDAAYMLWADPEREAGSRISIISVNPGDLFPIFNDEEELIGWHVIAEFLEGDSTFIHRVTYRKATETGGPSPINVTDELYEVDDWGGPGMEEPKKVVKVVNPPHTLPSPIDQLPVYKVSNFQTPGEFWGSSEMRGLERLMAAVNQSISDEELSLALEGLGVYTTDAGTPINDDGTDGTWDLGPARVVELPEGKTLKRVTGVSSVAPFLDHIRYLHSQINEATAMSDAAKGVVDVSVAESGVALAMQMAPLFARADEKDLLVTDTTGNMFFDLRRWYIAYEGGAFRSLENIRWMPTFGDRLPENRKERITTITELATASPPIISSQYAREKLRSLGFEDMPEETVMMNQILEEKRALKLAEEDAFGARVDADVDAELERMNTLAEGSEEDGDS